MKEYWTPFETATVLKKNAQMRDYVRQLDMDEEPDEIKVNSIYQVAIFRTVPVPEGWPQMIHLSIKRRDKKPIHDWRHMQRIKNEVIGPEHEGVELYPLESRLVDASNQYHLFVIAKAGVRWPFGFGERWVNNVTEHGAVQRPFPLDAMPKDVKTTAEYVREKMSEKEKF